MESHILCNKYRLKISNKIYIVNHSYMEFWHSWDNPHPLGQHSEVSNYHCPHYRGENLKKINDPNSKS